MARFTRFVRPLSVAAIATAASASAAHAGEPIGETGSIELSSTIDAGVLEVVDLRNSYVDPVVVAFINSRNGNESVQVRVDRVTGDQFAIFMEEPDGQGHAAETVSYLVMERGTHYLADGRTVEAGSVDTDTVHRGADAFAGDAVAFAADFDSAPAVLHGLNSYTNGDFMASMATAVDADGFQIGLEAAETGAAAAVETVAYIAIEAGAGTLDGAPYLVGSESDGSSDGVGQGAHTIDFDFEAAPDVIVSVIGQNGVDGSWARGAGSFGPTRVAVYAEEDQINDNERGHADEVFAYAAFEADSDLFAADGHLKWRIRNATAIDATGQWVIRELAFCADADCAEPLSGAAFDDGNSRDWSLPANAFDGDDDTLWKTFGVEAGAAYIGLEFDSPQQVAGIAVDKDNAVYIPDAFYVEYHDADADEWVVADYIQYDGADVQTAVPSRERYPTAWRISTAVDTASNAWALRELDFCADADCATPLAGTVIESGDAYAWAPAEQAFDDDVDTFYKTSSADAGQYIGLDFGALTDVAGLYVRTDNAVYTAGELKVEYYDIVSAEWVVADYVMGFAASADHQLAITVRDRFPVSWRLTSLVDTASNAWALRELAFCTDADCATAASGEAFDSGSYAWAPADNAFDGDTDTFWKTSSAAAGQYIGQDFAGVTDIDAVYIRTDNSVYTADEVELAYYDIVLGEWVSAASISGFAQSADHVIALD